MAFVQITQEAGLAASVQVTLDNPTPVENLLAVVVSWLSSLASFVSISDDAGNVYDEVGTELVAGSFLKSRLFVTVNTVPGIRTVTVELSDQAAEDYNVVLAEYSNVDPADPIDSEASAALVSNKTAGLSVAQVEPSRLLAFVSAEATPTVMSPGWSANRTTGFDDVRLFDTLIVGSPTGIQFSTPSPAALLIHLVALKPRVRTNGPLTVDPTNPRWLRDVGGELVPLVGFNSQWNLQDIGSGDPPSPAVSWSAILASLIANHCNYVRFWVWEQAKNGPGTTDPTFFQPSVYQRTGPGNADDGKLKFDVTLFDSAYFTRLRDRVIDCRDNGIYCSVMLFQGWGVGVKPSFSGDAWPAHPFKSSNNINSVNGDTNADSDGKDIHEGAAAAITTIQQSYIDHVFAEIDDLDNWFFEIGNEMDNSVAGHATWLEAIATYIRTFSSRPILFSAEFPSGTDASLFARTGEMVTPLGATVDTPAVVTGSKVVVVDTDHGTLNYTTETAVRQHAWKAVTRGAQYSSFRSLVQTSESGLEFVRPFLSVVSDLRGMVPSSTLASTTWCLAKNATPGEYLVFAPLGGSFTVDLTNTTGVLRPRWQNAAGLVINGGMVPGGGVRTLVSPDGAEAVLHLISETIAEGPLSDARID